MKNVAHMYMRATFRAPNFRLKLKQLCSPAKPFSTAIQLGMHDMTLLNVRFGLVNIPLSMLCDHVVVQESVLSFPARLAIKVGSRSKIDLVGGDSARQVTDNS